MGVKISIIVPVYNTEKYLEKCIKSILDQTFTDFELILINDGSKDSSGYICDEYAQKDKRVKVIHKKNGGLSSARNEGLDISQGEYIAFVDSDDYINKNMYKVLYKNAIKTNADISMCDFQHVYDDENIEIDNIKDSGEYLTFNNIEALNQLHTKDGLQFVVAYNKLYKRNIFSNLRYDYGKIHEDEFIIHKLLYKCKKIVYTSLPLYYYLQRKGSITQSDFNIKRLDCVYALEERFEFFKERKLKELQNKALIGYVRIFFKNYYEAKNQLSDIDKELKNLKKYYNKKIIHILKSSYYNWKEKGVMTLFFINPKLYELYHRIRGIDLSKK